MPLKKGSTLRKGDVVNLRGVVEYDWTDDGGSSIHIKIPGVYIPVTVFGGEGLEAVTFLHSAFVKGESVKEKHAPGLHAIIYTVCGSSDDGAHIWCQDARGEFSTFPAAKLIKAEPGDKNPVMRGAPPIPSPEAVHIRDDEAGQ